MSVWGQFSTDGSPLALLLYSSEQNSVHRFSICRSPVRRFPERSLTVVVFPCFSGQVFHQLVCPLTVVLPQIFFYLTTLFSYPVFFSSFHAQRMTTPSFAEKRGCSTIIEEREVSWSRQHPSRTGPSRWRGYNHRSHDNLLQDLADRRMANPMGPVPSHHTSQEKQPAAVPELPNNKPHQSPKQSHAEDHTEQIEATSGEDHRRRTGRLQSRKEYQRADLQPTQSM